MSTRPPDRCGGRIRRPGEVPMPPGVAAREEVALSSLGAAFIEALRDDERFAAIIADPFGEHGPIEP